MIWYYKWRIKRARKAIVLLKQIENDDNATHGQRCKAAGKRVALECKIGDWQWHVDFSNGRYAITIRDTWRR